MKELRVYTLNEVADILHITRRTLYNYIKEGTLNASKVGGRWRVTEEELRKLLGTSAEE